MKKKILFMMLLISFINANAQPVIKAQKVIGANDLEEMTCMIVTSDKGLIAGGLTYSGISGDKTDTSRGELDYWIIKLDSTGKKMWDKTFGGSEEDRIYDIQQTADGGYILGGTSESDISGEKSQNKASYRDMWIIKLDASGNMEWDKTVGRTGDYAHDLKAICQTGDGGYMIGASINYASNPNPRGYLDYYVLKLDANGNMLWDNVYGGDANDDLSAMQQTKDGGFILGGSSGSNMSFEKSENTRGGAGAYDYWILKIDAAGNKEWDKTIGGNDYDFCTALQQTKDEGYIIGGHSASGIFAEKTKPSKGSNDYWVVKLDKAGNIQWDNVYGGSQTDLLTTVLQTSDKGYLFGGNSRSGISGDKTEPVRFIEEDYWVVKTDNAGNKLWDKTVGGSAPDLLISLKEVKRNVFLLGGSSSSPKSYDKTKPALGSYDFWFVLLDATQTVNPATFSKVNNMLAKPDPGKEFSVYPNPAKDVLHIQTTNKTSIIITDVSGKIWLQKNITGSENINVTQLPAGSYYLKDLETGKQQKILIIK